VADSESGSHWQDVYRITAPAEFSWYQAEPTLSVDLIATASGIDAGVVDVGAGTSFLVDRLAELGYRDLTVVDISELAVAEVRARFPAGEPGVTFVSSDVLDWAPGRTFDVWHDRAVFHFLTTAEQRARYCALVEESVVMGGQLIVATFALDGPERCSGLEVCRYDGAGLAAEFTPAFELLDTGRSEHLTPWKSVQPFTWVRMRRAKP